MKTSEIRMTTWYFVVVAPFVLGATVGVFVERNANSKATRQKCDARFELLFQGRCSDAKCLVTWDEMAVGVSDSNLGRRSATTLDYAGPIDCPKKDEIPWVKGNGMGTVDFTCAPRPKGGP